MPTIQEKREAMQALIDRQAYGVLFSAEDVEKVNALTGWSFHFYRRVHNPMHPSDKRCIANSVDGETFDIWSWNKALTPSDNLMAALRKEVAEQMQDYKGKAVRECAACGTQALITVDHKSIPFRDIAIEFKDQHGHIPLANDNNGSGWYIDSPEVAGAWQLFHKRRADYQILCRSCNSKKGTRNAIR